MWPMARYVFRMPDRLPVLLPPAASAGSVSTSLEAFSPSELRRIAAERVVTDLVRAASWAWPETRGCKTLLPGPADGVAKREPPLRVTVLVREDDVVRTFTALTVAALTNAPR